MQEDDIDLSSSSLGRRFGVDNGSGSVPSRRTANLISIRYFPNPSFSEFSEPFQSRWFVFLIAAIITSLIA
jgi:hypothetical protein